MPGSSAPQASRPEWFATTHWSVVIAAGRGDDSRAQAALDRLCRTYWYPLYAFVRHSGQGSHDAEDLVQAFFARCLEKNYLADADRDRGRFRTFLLVALKRFLANEWDRARARKRGGAHATISLDALAAEQRYALEPAHVESADRLYERRWALTLLEKVLQRLEEENAGKPAQFGSLKEALTAPGATRYAELAARVGLSEGAVKVAVHRLRQRYRALLEEEIANTAACPDEIEAERRFLLAVLSR